MKKLWMLCAALALLAGLLTGCGTPQNQAVKLVSLEQEQGNTALWYYDGTTVVRKELNENDRTAVIEKLNSLTVSPVKNLDLSAAAAPLYGLSVDQGEYDFLAVVCAGVWLDSAGGQYSLTEDFRTVWDAYAGEETQSDLTAFPNIRALAQNGESWNTDFLAPAVLDFPMTDLLELQLSSYNPETGVLQVRVCNNDLTTYCTSEKFRFQVCVNGDWYEVPVATAQHIDLPSSSIDITRHLPQTVMIQLSPYGDLPQGTYRVAKVVSNIFGVAPDGTILAELEL